MENHLKYVVIGIAFLTLSFESLGQSAKEILVKLNKTYHNQSYQMDYNVSSINTSQKKSIAKYSGSVAKDGDQFYLNTTGDLTIINNDHYMFINKSEKKIYFNDIPNNKERKNNSMDILGSLDSLIEVSGAKLVNNKNDVYTISIKLALDDTYSEILLKINKSYELIGCVYLFKDESYPFDKISIAYTNIRIGKRMDKHIFSTKSIVKVKNKKILPVGLYTSYTVIDNRNIITQ